MSVNVKEGAPSLTLTLITNLPTNRLNNKYIFRPRSVVCVREGKKTRLLPSLTHTLRGLKIAIS